MDKIKFGSTSNEIDDLANKVLREEKVATSSLLDYHLQGLKPASKVGDYFSIQNSSDKEVAIVRVEKIEVIKFGDITETFAIEEGDVSLENWLAIHRPYYSKLLSEIGKELSQDTLLVCEWFRVIKTYPTRTQSIALQFNSCINNADIEGLADLMTEDHVFIDMENNRIEGKSDCISMAWKPFFKLFPNYQNIFEHVITQGDSTVIMQGYSISSDERLNNIRAIWLAKVKEEKVSLWHIYTDNEEIRSMLGF
ncbi:ASCH domain-containing protein [Dysgonomonas massiliensis]|uniref:ASCH domain-containing protein n=1 Tax=Dysgonomonas massiliensis TaxID=2040292 RepID=UPI000C785CF9|nr:ASCH domain-containing protein [Dysgonomonas massiliensis]